jgi:hypothetical protein
MRFELAIQHDRGFRQIGTPDLAIQRRRITDRRVGCSRGQVVGLACSGDAGTLD